MIAVFAPAATTGAPPSGWSFLWNAGGELGDAGGYAPLVYDDTTKGYGVLGDNGLRTDAPYSNRNADVHGVRGPDGVARYFIASYALRDDAQGDVWVHHGNLRNKSFATGSRLSIYVNDEKKAEFVPEYGPVAHLFQAKLGKLNKGDAIRVAVGPGDGARMGGGRLHFTIVECAVGEAPGDPIPIVSAPIASAHPVRGPDGDPDKAYLAKHEAQCAAVLEKRPELVFIGDSITARWPPELLEEKFGQYRPMSLGIGGDWIQNVRWRIEQGVFEQVPPRVIVLMIGTNNLTAGFSSEDIAAGVAGLVEVLRAKAPTTKILIHGILPRGDSIEGPVNEQARKANAAIAKLADRQHVFYLDVTPSLIETDGTFVAGVMRPDKLHVDAPGYVRWMDLLYPVVKALLEGGGN